MLLFKRPSFHYQPGETMPRVILYFNERGRFRLTGEATPNQAESCLGSTLSHIGSEIRKLVAEATSTDETRFCENDIDWIPIAVGPGALCPELQIDIQTIGFPDRIAKMNTEALMELKRKIIAIKGFPKWNIEYPLIWLQFQDPRGAHV